MNTNVNIKKNQDTNQFKEFKQSLLKLDDFINSPKQEEDKINPYQEYKVGYKHNSDNEFINDKKYIGLTFYESIKNYYSQKDDIKETHSVKLKRDSVYLINYYISMSINKNECEESKYFILFGIKNNSSDKISVINGSKTHFESNEIIDESMIVDEDKITVNNTIIHYNKEDSELFSFAQIDNNCVINNKKSYLKIVQCQ